MDLSAKLTKVTVFPDRAQLYREAVVALKPGEHTLLVSGTWANVDRDTLQVATKKGGEHTILRSVQFTTIRSTQDLRPERVKIDEEMKPVEAKIRELNDGIAICNTAIRSYEAVSQKFNSVSSESFHSSHRDPEVILRFMTFVSKGIAEQTTARRQLEKELTEVNAQKTELQRRRRVLGDSDERVTSKDVAEILVKVTHEVELVLQISYIVRGPSWTPSYDLRVDSNTKTLDVAYNATVKQSTGEYWENVALELSTAKQFGASPPAAERWNVSFYVPRPAFSSYGGGPVRGPAMSNVMPQMMMQQMMVNEMRCDNESDEEESIPAPPPPVRMTTESAKVTQSATSATFEVAGRHTIKSDGEPVRVAIMQQVFKAYFRYSAVPKLSTHTYLKVKVTNSTPYTFLPGKTNIFADNQYVSNSVMNQVAPNEDFWTFIGIEESIPVTRTEQGKSVPNDGWMSKTIVKTFRSKFTVKNKKKTTEEIVIWDQLPISEDKKLKVTLLTPATKAGDPDNGKEPKYLIDKDNFIEWIVQLKPQEERVFFFEFSVESPKDDVVSGL